MELRPEDISPLDARAELLDGTVLRSISGFYEVQTALGRSGRFLASEAWPRRPEVALIAKTLGGGLVPISAMLTRRDVFERAYGRNLLLILVKGEPPPAAEDAPASEPPA